MYSNPYNYNDPSVDLDKLARKVNDQRKKLANNVAMEFDKDMNEINMGINRLEKSKNKIYLPTSMTNNLPPTYGEFTNRNLNIPTFSENSDNSVNISETNSNDKYQVFSENSSYGSFSSLPDSLIKDNNYDSINEKSDGESIFTEGISELSLSIESKLPTKVKSKLKENKHLNNLNSDEDILTHVNTCSSCRKELLNLITNANYCNSEEFHNINVVKNKNNKFKQKTKTSDMKDLIIILMIRLFIMILLDLFMRKK